jgi:hypothetical protein
MIKSIRKKLGRFTIYTLVVLGIVSAKAGDLSYLGKDLSVPPVISLLDNGHPVSNKLAGKEISLHFDDVDEVVVGRFVDDKNIN